MRDWQVFKGRVHLYEGPWWAFLGEALADRLCAALGHPVLRVYALCALVGHFAQYIRHLTVREASTAYRRGRQ